MESVNQLQQASSLVTAALALACVGTAVSAEPQTIAVPTGNHPPYEYGLEVGKGKRLCAHMKRVFNDHFSRLWQIPLDIGRNEHSVEGGKYTFPQIEGIEYEPRATMTMIWTKLPSSPEFESIAWREGRMVTGAPPGVEIPQSRTPRPVLIAHFDFDNDGHQDTVVKSGFSGGYYAILGGHSGEYLYVLCGKTIDIEPGTALWTWLYQIDPEDVPLSVAGQYLRPFIYRDRAYVAQYEAGFNDPASRSPNQYAPDFETMSVVEYKDEGERSELTGARIWSERIVCKYKMTKR